MISLILIIIVLTLLLIISFIFANKILHPHRQKIVRFPSEYGMEFQEVEFPSIDGLKIKGWLIQGKTKKIIILTHAMPFNRHGFIAKNQGFLKFFQTDVDLLKTAKALYNEGYSILMFDFRNHGESDSGITGVGLNEYQDVLGAVNFVRNNHKLDSKHIGFVSFCMGANATIIALSKAREVLKNIKCVVAIQPISMNVFLQYYTKDKFTSLSLAILTLVDFWVQSGVGYPINSISPYLFCKDIKCPIMYIQAKTDPWTDLKDIEQFYNATNSEKEFWYLEEKMGRFDAYNYVGEHPQKIIKFLKKYM